MSTAVAKTVGVTPQKQQVSITPTMRAEAEMKLKKAKVQLAINHPFFSSILMRRKIQLLDNLPTACIDARGTISVGTMFINGLNVPQVMFLLAHEVMHYAMMHHIRRGWRNPRAWNIAGDKVINDILETSNVGQRIDGGTYQAGAKAFAAEQLYQEDPDAGEGGGAYQAGEGFDDLDGSGGSPLDESEIREIEAQVRIEVAQANHTAKQRGNAPVGLERLIEDIINPTTPWHILLERFMTGFVNADYSWRRPRRSTYAHGLYLPSSNKVPSMGPVVIQVDESGSIGAEELKHFAGHINRILETCRPEKVIVLHTDTHVAKVEEYELDDLPITLKAYAGGGTDMVAGIRWCEANGVEPDVFVCLTDGYTPWPDKEPAFPLAWLITTDEKAPVGETIKYEIC